MRPIFSRITRFVAQEDGATLTEYCMVAILIALVCVSIVQAIGGIVVTMFAVSNSV